jgi:hypothetical protein
LNLEEAGSWVYPPRPGHGKPFQGQPLIDSVKRQVKVNKDQEAGSKHGLCGYDMFLTAFPTKQIGVMVDDMSSLYFFREWPMFFDSHCDG